MAARDISSQCVAVATLDGGYVDACLERAHSLWIYRVTSGGVSALAEVRDLPGNEEIGACDWQNVGHLFEAVDVAVASRVGPQLVAALSRHGILALALSGPVSCALSALGRRGWSVTREPAGAWLEALPRCGKRTKLPSA